MDDVVKTRAYKNVAQYIGKHAARKRDICIEDRAGRGLPQILQTKAVIVPRLLAADGKLVTDAIEKKKDSYNISVRGNSRLGTCNMEHRSTRFISFTGRLYDTTYGL